MFQPPFRTVSPLFPVLLILLLPAGGCSLWPGSGEIPEEETQPRPVPDSVMEAPKRACAQTGSPRARPHHSCLVRPGLPGSLAGCACRRNGRARRTAFSLLSRAGKRRSRLSSSPCERKHSGYPRSQRPPLRRARPNGTERL